MYEHFSVRGVSIQMDMAQSPSTDDEATCANPDCDEPTPWDMASVRLDDAEFCSPECARAHLDRTGAESVPQRVTLHDPQFAVDRSDLSGVAEDAIDIGRPIEHGADARRALDEIEEMFPGEFRPTPDSDDE